MIAFYDFALKIESTWAKKVVKSSLDVIVYVWFIYFAIKKIKNIQFKKE